jgi:hypothetical protein
LAFLLARGGSIPPRADPGVNNSALIGSFRRVKLIHGLTAGAQSLVSGNFGGDRESFLRDYGFSHGRDDLNGG